MLKMVERSFMASWYIYIGMFGVILMGGYFIHKLRKYQKDFEAATVKIKSNDSFVDDLRNYFEGIIDEQEPLFQTTALQNTLIEYRDTYRKTLTTKGAAPFVDITDFYSSEYLDEIGATGICDLISGTMTGLGILGTFLGLVLGISGFDTTTATAITSSISSLLGGMGTAFFTSIVGVFLSLIFSYVHKIAYENANKSLEGFVVAFHSKNLDGSEKMAENQLLDYQKQQTDLMGSFATVVSEAVSSSISSTMKTELVPIFDRMENTIEQFGALASQQQKEGLDRVVKEFIHCMNESLNQQFEELSDTIHEICEWQKASAEQMHKIVDGICDTSAEINHINELSKQTVSEMNDVVTQLDSYYEKLSSATEQMQNQIERNNEIQEKQSDYIEKLVESEQHIAALTDVVKLEIENNQNSIDMLTAHCKEQVVNIETAAKQSLDVVAESTKLVADASQQQITALAQTADKEMQTLSASAAQLSEDNRKQLEELTKVSSGQVALLAGATEAAQKSVDLISDHCKDQISGIVEAAKQDMEALSASTKVLTEASHAQMETLAQTAESEMQMLSGAAAQMSEENHKQLTELTKASSEQMTILSAAANNVMQNSQQQITAAIEATQAQSDALMQATNDFADFVQKQNQKLVDAVDKEVAGLSNFAGQTTNELQSATAGMENAAKLLDKNLDDVLSRTFDSFDSGLTDISQHLSGTIADVRDTTEALPHVIRESQQQYKAVFAQLTSQTQSYLDAMEKLTELVKQTVPAVADEEGNRQ